MAHLGAQGLTPAEVGFLCEMELITVVPRQQLNPLNLIGGQTETLHPPFTASLPLWLALLLKRQRRANIVPPAWLTVDSLTAILEFETDDRTATVFSPTQTLASSTTISAGQDEYLSRESLELSAPFVANSSTSRSQADALPYHWLELSHLLLTQASDDFDDPNTIRRLVRDLREVRMSKLRKGFRGLDAGGGVNMNGVGGMEIAEVREFVGEMIDALRNLNRSREETRRERETEDRDNGRDDRYQDDDDEMQL